MGGLYNALFGVNPAAAFLLPMLGHEEGFYPRLRDVFAGKGADGVREIQVFTRVGSLNQGYDMGEERLYAEPNFLRFEDCEDDATYGTYIFKCPQEWERDFDCILEGRLHEVSDSFIAKVESFWPNKGKEIAAMLAQNKARQKGDK